jgi:hypothetical protein
VEVLVLILVQQHPKDKDLPYPPDFNKNLLHLLLLPLDLLLLPLPLDLLLAVLPDLLQPPLLLLK